MLLFRNVIRFGVIRPISDRDRFASVICVNMTLGDRPTAKAKCLRNIPINVISIIPAPITRSMVTYFITSSLCTYYCVRRASVTAVFGNNMYNEHYSDIDIFYHFKRSANISVAVILKSRFAQDI